MERNFIGAGNSQVSGIHVCPTSAMENELSLPVMASCEPSPPPPHPSKTEADAAKPLRMKRRDAGCCLDSSFLQHDSKPTCVQEIGPFGSEQ